MVSKKRAWGQRDHMWLESCDDLCNYEIAIAERFPDYLQAVEEMSERSGIPAPRCYVADIGNYSQAWCRCHREQGGDSLISSSICLSTSLALRWPEGVMRAAIAHEIAHIADCKPWYYPALPMAAIGAIAGAAHMTLARLIGRSLAGCLSSRLFVCVNVLTDAALSRRAEYSADEESVRILGSRRDVINALLLTYAHHAPYGEPTGARSGPMMWARRLRERVLDDHPSDEQRIRRLLLPHGRDVAPLRARSRALRSWRPTGWKRQRAADAGAHARMDLP